MDLKKAKESRKDRNRDLVRRMRSGETLTLYAAEHTFFPPRPRIKKDEEVLARLYGVNNPPK